jgi:hypothetical protein
MYSLWTRVMCSILPKSTAYRRVTHVKNSTWIPFVYALFAHTSGSIIDNLADILIFSCNVWIYKYKLTLGLYQIMRDKFNYVIIVSTLNTTKLTTEQFYKMLVLFLTGFTSLLFVTIQRQWQSFGIPCRVFYNMRNIQRLVMINASVLPLQRTSEHNTALVSGIKASISEQIEADSDGGLRTTWSDI